MFAVSLDGPDQVGNQVKPPLQASSILFLYLMNRLYAWINQATVTVIMKAEKKIIGITIIPVSGRTLGYFCIRIKNHKMTVA
jgi:hypothetical protein